MFGGGDAGKTTGTYTVNGNSLILRSTDLNTPGITFDLKWSSQDAVDLRPVPDGEAVKEVDSATLDALTLHIIRKSTSEHLTGQEVTDALNQRSSSNDTPHDESADCASNVKQLELGLSLYTQDYDEVFPSRTWQDAIYPYVKRADLFDCPAKVKAGLRNGYALNSDLLGVISAQIKLPESTPGIFDADIDGPDASASPSLLPKPARHPKGNTVGYVDGHVGFQP